MGAAASTSQRSTNKVHAEHQSSLDKVYIVPSPAAQKGGAYNNAIQLGKPPVQAMQVKDTSTTLVDVVDRLFSAEQDCLQSHSTTVWDDTVASKLLPPDVFKRFQEATVTGEKTSEFDMQVIADAMFAWARELGATSFAHWFFPMRGGGGAVGGALGALKMDYFIDLEWSSKFPNKPLKPCFPGERLFQGETDGSSFPNGGLRVTHAAAAFTTWDRSSPPMVVDKVLRIPCSFVTQFGMCIDDKTPLLRSSDAVQREGLRLLKALGLCADAKAMYSYLGWEQEFFVIDAAYYKARPDLVNCGRTLIGRLPHRHQQADLNYFAPVPERVNELLERINIEMMKAGCAMAVKHNEVAPAQHEMSPIFKVANASADQNVLFMDVCNREAGKLGLQVLFHEKPFAGINGSGKHSNWSVGTDTGVNFFHPGKTNESKIVFTAAVACLAHGLKQYNELVRCCVAHAGNDHRLGAQEAPPAIISLYPGSGFEQHVDFIINGGDLLGYKWVKKLQDTGCKASMPIEANIEDRNRTAPFPFCSNRFEFRAVGSSQNCSFPVMICNTVMAAGMSYMSDLIESGKSVRDAVAQVYSENRAVIFTGNGYSSEWPAEAEKRGLPNLNTTPKAIAHFMSAKNKAVFSAMQIYSEDETHARCEVMYEAYNSALNIEASTLVYMMETGMIPACARDLKTYDGMDELAGERKSVYTSIVQHTQELKALMGKLPQEAAEQATYLCDIVKPQMSTLRKVVDDAEGLMQAALYPYPTYEAMLYHHHH